jgi:hypothetical protein
MLIIYKHQKNLTPQAEHILSFLRWNQEQAVDRETYLIMDGFMGEKISLEQGVPQGDILSPYIFKTAVVFLLMKITHMSSIKGIKFARTESRAETSANGTTIILKRTVETET